MISAEQQPVNWGLIGPGNIGKEIINQIGKNYVAERLNMNPAPKFIMSRSGIHGRDGEVYGSLEEIEEFPDVTFVAMPSYDDGVEATKYISSILERGAIAVTAEKGALANNFVELESASESFKRLGVNATVGGGTRLLDVAELWCRDPENITEIHLALNGTLSAIMSNIGPKDASAMSLGRAVHQAVKLGYAEPGADNAFEVIRGETTGDIPKKTAIFFNKLGLSDRVLDYKDLKFDLNDSEIAAAYEESRVRRFLVSLYATNAANYRGPESDIYGGFDVEHENWRIVCGFRNVHGNPLFSELARITGPGAGIVVGLGPNESDGVYHMTGDGAGVAPTANAMIDDYLAKAHKQIKRTRSRQP